MDNFNEMVKKKSEYKQARENKYKDDSKARLSTIMKKKIETTFVGALSSVEEHFGFLWEPEGGLEMSDDQYMMSQIFQKLRSDILDKGNAQRRNVDAELNQYEVDWKKYKMDLPMKPQPSIRGNV
jgi:hypothetical protein